MQDSLCFQLTHLKSTVCYIIICIRLFNLQFWKDSCNLIIYTKSVICDLSPCRKILNIMIRLWFYCSCHRENVYALRRKITKNGPLVLSIYHHYFADGSEFEQDEDKMLLDSCHFFTFVLIFYKSLLTNWSKICHFLTYLFL